MALVLSCMDVCHIHLHFILLFFHVKWCAGGRRVATAVVAAVAVIGVVVVVAVVAIAFIANYNRADFSTQDLIFQLMLLCFFILPMRLVVPFIQSSRLLAKVFPGAKL